MPFRREMHIRHTVRRAVITIDLLQVWKIMFRHVVRPVMAIRDQQLRSRCGHRSDLDIVRTSRTEMHGHPALAGAAAIKIIRNRYHGYTDLDPRVEGR